MAREHILEFLLAFDDRVHWLQHNYRLKFEIQRVEPSAERPHGLRYSLTLHDPNGKRLVGFDNAHAVSPPGTRFRKRPMALDRWHRTEGDEGRLYEFVSAYQLLQDFFREARRVLNERGLSDVVVRVDERKNP
jgi:uncharacterized protein DUF6516